MKKIFSFSVFVLLIGLFNGQSNKQYLDSFFKDIVVKKDYDFENYSKYIKYYNDIKIDDSNIVNNYFSNIKFLTENTINNNIKDNDDLEIKKISYDKLLADNVIDFGVRDIKGYSFFAVYCCNKVVSYVILNDKKEIISFFSKLNKNNRKYKPWFLDDKIE